MNKWAWMSLGMVIVNFILFLLLRGPNVNLPLVVAVESSLSIIGIVCAVLSKKIIAGTAGFVLNGGVLIVMGFLLLAMGISEP
ncbi:hypothetical protein ACJA3J_07310 [Halobacillus sp. SY10]|uniref:Uncharacterized protein n=2 Tax=Halobacillus TaxID=45667 RepID=A0A1H0FN31_HALAD|nr:MULTISPECIES: hypothetical protein [Halobacillus]RDY71123.1 hypothetical protein DXT76_09155 [Halobacillus trueperi]SDN96083.1 hypothetical protein SAMN05421677_10260 [Halobacillus aidingensis]